MNTPVIQKATLDFLRNLSANNNREWFAANRDRYEMAKTNVEHFIDALIVKMNTHDRIETPSAKKSLYRIYKDVRFSRDKTPYSASFSGYLRRLKPALRGGYYFWIKPGGNSGIGCGFTYPNPDDLRRIRQDIDLNHDDWYKVLGSKALVKTFGAMQGSQVRTAPRGFDADHPAIELLRFKQFWFEKTFADKEVLSGDFLLNMNKTFKAIRPFFDYMSEVLNTNANGEAI
jgi:uncharacterized protein (TIGR02453 family)